MTDRSASSNLSTRSGPSIAEVRSALVALAIKDGVSEELAKLKSELRRTLSDQERDQVQVRPPVGEVNKMDLSRESNIL